LAKQNLAPAPHTEIEEGARLLVGSGLIASVVPTSSVILFLRFGGDVFDINDLRDGPLLTAGIHHIAYRPAAAQIVHQKEGHSSCLRGWLCSQWRDNIIARGPERHAHRSLERIVA